MTKLPVNPIVRNVTKHFPFLFDRGFKVSNTSNFLESFGNWFVEFESSDCFIVVFSHQAEVFVTFYPVKTARNTVTDLGFMVYYLTNGEVFIDMEERNPVGSEKKQLERSAKLLEEYIDRIVPYFGHSYEENKKDLIAATEKFDAFQLAKHGLQRLKRRVRGL